MTFTLPLYKDKIEKITIGFLCLVLPSLALLGIFAIAYLLLQSGVEQLHIGGYIFIGMGIRFSIFYFLCLNDHYHFVKFKDDEQRSSEKVE